jgi:carbon monoxide dehydrogenase subunit G
MKLNYLVPASVEEVFPYFADLKKFVDVHPVIFRIDELGSNEYLFYEKMDLFLFKYTFTYKVILESVDLNKRVVMHSKVQRGVYLHLTFSFDQEKGQTKIDEIVHIKAFPFIRAIFKPILRKSHLKLVNEISNRLNKHSNRVL